MNPPLDDIDAVDDRTEVRALVSNLKSALPQLERLLEECASEWGYEDPIYRFYHQSFKVYALGRTTKRIVSALQALAPAQQLNEWFVRIVNEGTDKEFAPEHNQRWLEVTRPIVEAFFHSRYFLEMAVRYERQLTAAPQMLPSGWAALLYCTACEMRSSIRRWLRMIAAAGLVQMKGVGSLFQPAI